MSLPLLPSQTEINPASPVDHEYHASPDVLYVFDGVDADGDQATIAASSAGDLGSEFEIGTRHVVVHDQTGDEIGDFTVVGIVDEDGDVTGDAPDEDVDHHVFK